MATTDIDLTIEICSEDGSHTQFYQNDEDSISKVLSLLITPRLFTQPLLTLASERSVSTVPCRTIDLILARTPKIQPLLLPPGWLDIVQVGTEAFHNEAILNIADDADGESLPVAVGITSHLEIHTVGDWMINLKLQTVIQEKIQDQHQLLIYFFDLPVIPFRLETGGVGFINPAKISRLTMYPAINGVAKTGLPADLLRCVRR
jgi:hypothetical protein